MYTYTTRPLVKFGINYVNNFKSHVDTKLSYLKGDYVTINNDLSNVDWNQLLTHEDVNKNWSSFADKLSILTRNHIPVCNSAPRKCDTPWTVKDTLQAVKRKRSIWKKFKYSLNPVAKGHYEKAKIEAYYKIRKAKLNYEKSIAKKMKTDSKISGNLYNQKPKLKRKFKLSLTKNVAYIRTTI